MQSLILRATSGRRWKVPLPGPERSHERHMSNNTPVIRQGRHHWRLGRNTVGWPRLQRRFLLPGKGSVRPSSRESRSILTSKEARFGARWLMSVSRRLLVKRENENWRRFSRNWRCVWCSLEIPRGGGGIIFYAVNSVLALPKIISLRLPTRLQTVFGRRQVDARPPRCGGLLGPGCQHLDADILAELQNGSVSCSCRKHKNEAGSGRPDSVTWPTSAWFFFNYQ